MKLLRGFQGDFLLPNTDSNSTYLYTIWQCGHKHRPPSLARLLLADPEAESDGVLVACAISASLICLVGLRSGLNKLAFQGFPGF